MKVDIKRKTSRQQIYSDGRNLETEAETSLQVKKAAERRQKSEGLPSGSAAKAAAVRYFVPFHLINLDLLPF